ncbi:MULTISPECIES: hypothetical protein [Salinibaculum]|uniref:hypothetical protein n=1 Tax=Salinibaculum TaxID=2732368 RepID=UPI0030CDCE06
MNDVIRSRLRVLAGLAVLGIGLAGAGTAFGMAGPLAGTGPTPEFVVSDETVTFSAGGESDTVVGNLSRVSELTIEETSAGQFTIRTADDHPLTRSERRRARTIATSNATVRQTLNSVDTYELTVEPVQTVNVSASNVVSLNITGEERQANGTFRGEFSITDSESATGEDGVVTLTRDSSYVDGRAVVHVRQPGVDSRQALHVTVDVDLVNGTVTDILNWNTLGQESSTVTGKTTEIAG